MIDGIPRKNKKYIPPAMAPSKQREELSTVFGFYEQVIMCIYMPKEKTRQSSCYHQYIRRQKLVIAQSKNQKLLSFITGQRLEWTR